MSIEVGRKGRVLPHHLHDTDMAAYQFLLDMFDAVLERLEPRMRVAFEVKRCLHVSHPFVSGVSGRWNVRRDGATVLLRCASMVCPAAAPSPETTSSTFAVLLKYEGEIELPKQFDALAEHKDGAQYSVEHPQQVRVVSLLPDGLAPADISLPGSGQSPYHLW